MKVIRLVAGLAGVVALGAALACEKVGIEGNNCRANGADIVIDTRDAGAFDPPTIQVAVGQEVCWQNLGTVSHTITADEPIDSIDVVLPPTFIYSHGFGIIRDFNYHCTTHGETGIIKVR